MPYDMRKGTKKSKKEITTDTFPIVEILVTLYFVKYLEENWVKKFPFWFYYELFDKKETTLIRRVRQYHTICNFNNYTRYICNKLSKSFVVCSIFVISSAWPSKQMSWFNDLWDPLTVSVTEFFCKTDMNDKKTW